MQLLTDRIVTSTVEDSRLVINVGEESIDHGRCQNGTNGRTFLLFAVADHPHVHILQRVGSIVLQGISLCTHQERLITRERVVHDVSITRLVDTVRHFKVLNHRRESSASRITKDLRREVERIVRRSLTPRSSCPIRVIRSHHRVVTHVEETGT